MLSTDALAIRKTYIALDGLRGAAAFAVVFLHVLDIFTAQKELYFHGFLAVDLFFMLSGFVVAHAYEARLLARVLTILDFVKLRLTRLWPLAALGSCLGLVGALIAPIPDMGPAVLSGVFGLSLMLAPQLAFKSAEVFPLDGVLWSLTVEIVANLLYVALVRRLSDFRLLVISAAFFVVLVALVWLKGNASIGHQAGDFWAAFVRAGYAFPLGVLIYRRKDRLAGAGRWFGRLGAPGLALVLLAAFAGPYLLPAGHRIAAVYDLVLLGAVFPCLLLGGAFAKPGGRSADVCLGVGGFSYALYALHLPVLDVTARLSINPVIGLAASMGVAYMGYRLFDVPLQRALRNARAKGGGILWAPTPIVPE